MTEKELKRLSRAELLELLLMQTRESELLQMKLEAAKQELDARELNLREAGNLANAVLMINGVMESTQNAAQQYLDNIQRMEQETRQQCLQMMDDLEQVLMETQQILEEARRDPVPVPAVFLEETEPQPIPEEVPEAQEQPVSGKPAGLRELWDKASHKLLSLMHRCGLPIKQDRDEELDEQAGSL